MRTLSVYKGFEIQVTIAYDGDGFAGEYVIRPMRGAAAAENTAKFLARNPPGFERGAFPVDDALDDGAPEKLLVEARRAIDLTLEG